MNISELDRLMHTVLDGEATPAEAAELDRQLAADPAARQRFDDLKRLFDGGFSAGRLGRRGHGRDAQPPGRTAAPAPTFDAVACN